MKKFVAFVGSLGIMLTPLVTFAASDIFNTLGRIKSIVALAGPILMGLAFVFFVYNVIMFIFTQDAEAKDTARKSMIQSILGFVVILGLYGIVNLLLNTFGVDSNSAVGSQTGNLPTFTF